MKFAISIILFKKINKYPIKIKEKNNLFNKEYSLKTINNTASYGNILRLI